MGLASLLTSAGLRSPENQKQQETDIRLPAFLERIKKGILKGSTAALNFRHLEPLEVPDENAPSVQESILKERELLRRQKNRKSTILTSNQGVSATEPLQKALG